MFEENPTSRYATRLAHPEESQETNTAGIHILRDQENTGNISMDNSNCFAPYRDLQANATSRQNYLEKLKLLMSREKAEYESKITSLEQRHRELQSEITDLHLKLGQQRKRHRLVEMKLQNAETAKEDAERRNKMLQKEMEEVFETFREINRWK